MSIYKTNRNQIPPHKTIKYFVFLFSVTFHGIKVAKLSRGFAYKMSTQEHHHQRLGEYNNCVSSGAEPPISDITIILVWAERYRLLNNSNNIIPYFFIASVYCIIYSGCINDYKLKVFFLDS